MADDFDLGKWKKDLILRDFILNEEVANDTKLILLKKEFNTIFPNKGLDIHLPTANTYGKIRINTTEDISDEDLNFSKLALDKLGFELKEEDSFLNYEYDNDRKFYPFIMFTYL